MSRRALRRFAAASLLLWAGVTHAWANWHAEVATVENSGITAEISSPFEHCPPAGYMPLWVTIHNASGAARTWTVVCNSSRTSTVNGSKLSGTETLRVENGQTARVPVLMDVTPSSYGYYYQTYFVRVEGYGMADVENPLPGVNATAKGAGTHALGMSEALATPIWTSLTKLYADTGHDLMGTPVDLTLLGGDWRMLVGLDTLWLSDGDYNSLDASRRAMVHDWINHGGRLYVCAQSADPSLRAAVGLPEAKDTAEAGLGQVQIVPWDGKPLDLHTIETRTDTEPSARALQVAGKADWPIAREIGDIPINAPFLILFIVLFAVVVGPLNLFVFANAARRHRLFWTTPAISLGASLLLAGFIVLQDGFGGNGQRVVFSLLLPDEKKAVVFQEQVSRTGVLFSRQFTTAEDLVLTPVQVDATGGSRVYERAGRSYSGDWFTSRSVQTHRAEAVVPTRAEIQLLNADAAHDGAPPVVTSSVPATIRHLCYRDPAGRYWAGENLRTGERITLRRDEPTPNPTPPSPEEPESPAVHLAEPSGGSDQMDNAIGRLLNTPGCFVAYADDGTFFETLPSIRWKKQRAVFAGRISGAR